MSFSVVNKIFQKPASLETGSLAGLNSASSFEAFNTAEAGGLEASRISNSSSFFIWTSFLGKGAEGPLAARAPAPPMTAIAPPMAGRGTSIPPELLELELDFAFFTVLGAFLDSSFLALVTDVALLYISAADPILRSRSDASTSARARRPAVPAINVDAIPTIALRRSTSCDPLAFADTESFPWEGLSLDMAGAILDLVTTGVEASLS
mmetsp:Transcript_7669/g.11891  ORF Transcript_7669/g.11891 Transcript_7669/m.11891 type:complete len:208 (+) Transcript_7669:1544-2167(+)